MRTNYARQNKPVPEGKENVEAKQLSRLREMKFHVGVFYMFNQLC